MRIIARRQIEFAREMSIWHRLRLAIHANYLLPRSVRHARKNSGLGDGRIAFVFQHSANRDAFVTKMFDQQSSRLVIADNPDWQNVDPEIGEIIRRIGAAARSDGPFTMLENQHRRLARDTRNLTKDKLIGDQVSQK